MSKSRLTMIGLLAIAGSMATAAPAAMALPKLESVVAERGVEPVQYRNYCSRWRNECAHRWGWGTWRYRRCITAHGCH